MAWLFILCNVYIIERQKGGYTDNTILNEQSTSAFCMHKGIFAVVNCSSSVVISSVSICRWFHLDGSDTMEPTLPIQ